MERRPRRARIGARAADGERRRAERDRGDGGHAALGPPRLLRGESEPEPDAGRAGGPRCRLRDDGRAGLVDHALGGDAAHRPLPARPRSGRVERRRARGLDPDARRAGRAGGHHHLRGRGQSADVLAHERRPRIRDVRRRAAEREDADVGARRGDHAAVPPLARTEPRAPVPRLPPLHGRARPLHAVRRAATACARRDPTGDPGGPRRRILAEDRRREAARADAGRGRPSARALRGRDQGMGRRPRPAPRRAHAARARRLDRGARRRRSRRGVRGARAAHARLPPLRRDGAGTADRRWCWDRAAARPVAGTGDRRVPHGGDAARRPVAAGPAGTQPVARQPAAARLLGDPPRAHGRRPRAVPGVGPRRRLEAHPHAGAAALRALRPAGAIRRSARTSSRRHRGPTSWSVCSPPGKPRRQRGPRPRTPTPACGRS